MQLVKQFNVLLIEDNEGDFLLVKDYLTEIFNSVPTSRNSFPNK